MSMSAPQPTRTFAVEGRCAASCSSPRPPPLDASPVTLDSINEESSRSDPPVRGETSTSSAVTVRVGEAIAPPPPVAVRQARSRATRTTGVSVSVQASSGAQAHVARLEQLTKLAEKTATLGYQPTAVRRRVGGAAGRQRAHAYAAKEIQRHWRRRAERLAIERGNDASAVIGCLTTETEVRAIERTGSKLVIPRESSIRRQSSIGSDVGAPRSSASRSATATAGAPSPSSPSPPIPVVVVRFATATANSAATSTAAASAAMCMSGPTAGPGAKGQGPGAPADGSPAAAVISSSSTAMTLPDRDVAGGSAALTALSR